MYSIDLERVQQRYEKSKYKPPIARNAPVIAGNIVWARQLRCQIEEPMKEFMQMKPILGTKEFKKAQKLYSRLLSSLVEFESQWRTAWERAVGQMKDGMNATLLARDPYV